MTVYRTRPLPVAPSRGRLLIGSAVAEATLRALRGSGGGVEHEGAVFWLGRETTDAALILAMTMPHASTGPGHVRISETAVGASGRTARAAGLGLIAQVHSHPGRDTRHSDGDDDLVLLPFPGMFSLVVAHYGRGSLLPAEGAGLHQFQDGRWVQVLNDDALIVIPESL